MRNKQKMPAVLYNIYLVISIVAIIICYSGIAPGGKSFALLPIAYAVMLTVCRNLKHQFLSLTVIIINSVCLIRYALYPMALVASDNYNYSDESIYLMVYELIAVLIFLNFYSKRIDVSKRIDDSSYKSNELGTLNILLIAITIVFGVLFPSLLSIFIFYGTEAESVSGVISMTFSLGIMIIYSAIVSKLGNAKSGSGFGLLLAVIFAIFYIFITSFGETNVHRWKFLFVGIPTIYILVSSFPKHKKSIISFAFIALPISVFLGSFAKFAIVDRSLSSFSSFFLTSESLDAYFGGLEGITDALSILRNNVFAESFMSTLTDIFGNMPIASRFFNTDLFSTEALYLDGLGRTDLICPLVVQSVIHFGVVGAPILSILMTLIAVEGERFAKRAKTVYSLYGSIMLCVVFSMFMCLNTTIMLPILWKLLLFLIIQYFNEKFFINGKAVNYSPRLQRKKISC